MTDLVDYLRDKLEHAEDEVCICPDVDISTWRDHAAYRIRTIKGASPHCPQHGGGWIRE